MKSENGLGIIGIILIIIIIAGLITGAVFIINKNIDNEKNDLVKSNMLLIQGTCAKLKQESIKAKNTDMYIGTKISDMNEDEIINNFKSLGIVPEDQYTKYYCLNNDNLKALNLEIQNEEGSYYLISYDDNEVIITKGYQGKYKLSEIS